MHITEIITVFLHISIIVAALSKPQRSVLQRCIDFKKSLLTEMLTPGMAEKSRVMQDMIGKSCSWSCQTSNE